MGETKVDVAILGGGLSGNLLARQLRRALPDATLCIVEKATETSYKVGESTVEIASDYLIRRLGLSSYLYDQHLPKNGLRYFTDGAERDLKLTELSEIGSVALPYHPSFQIDRKRFEADLLEMNRADGVDVRVGVEVESVSLDAGGHRVQLKGPAGATQLEARWVVDAMGRRSMLATQLDLRVPEVDHKVAAAWGRFRGVKDIDSLGDAAWRGRVRETSRMLSTNHFCYRGYWIWFIPLGRGITSVGVVCTNEHWKPALASEEGFESFLREHGAVAELLEGAELIDVAGYRQLAYATKQFFSADRWGLVGDSVAFADPFYSPGSDFIAIENDLLTDLIERDLGGESEKALRRRCGRYDAWMQFRWEAAMALYRDLYRLLGSQELLAIRWDLDFCCYYNIWYDMYARDGHLDLDEIADQLDSAEGTLTALRNFAELFRETEEELTRRGHYHRSNRGEFIRGDRYLDFAEEVGTKRRMRDVHRKTSEIFNRTRRMLLELVEEPGCDSAPIEPLPFYRYLEEGSLK